MNDDVKMSVKDSLDLMKELMSMIKLNTDYIKILEKRIALLEKKEEPKPDLPKNVPFEGRL